MRPPEMCTVTWLRHTSGYELFCNRDEQRTRKPGIEPCVFEYRGVNCLAPLDGDFGGTWAGVNEFGISVCLLNRPGIRQTQSSLSRGLLVREALASRRMHELRHCLEFFDLRQYRAFTMVAVAPHGLALAFDWNGVSLRRHENAEALQPFTSSSFQTEAVTTRRVELYRNAGLRAEAFHTSHAAGPGPFSVCMHRADAQTVSFTRIHVDSKHVDLLYSPEPPCQGIAGLPVQLQRSAA